MLSANDFVFATGGGLGEYTGNLKSSDKNRIFQQHSWSSFPGSLNSNLNSTDSAELVPMGLGYGRIVFRSEEPREPKFYLRVPSSCDPHMLMYFFEHVWHIQRPKLVIGITGGASNSFMKSKDLERILNELIRIASQNDAWIITGGTDAGIMKYIGCFEPYLKFHGIRLMPSFFRHSATHIWRKHSVDWIYTLGSCMES